MKSTNTGHPLKLNVFLTIIVLSQPDNANEVMKYML